MIAIGCVLATVASGCSGTIVGPTQSGKVLTPPAGHPAAGKVVFTSKGCAACHTFGPAGSAGTLGPNLDQLAAYAKNANESLEQFTRSAIVNPPGAYVPPGFKNIMPTTFGASLTAQQVSDLVAFLTQGS